ALVPDVRIGAAVEQILRELILPVVRGGQERRPAVLGRLVDRRTAVEQVARRFDVAFARRKNQGGQATAAGTNQARHDHIAVVGRVSVGASRRRRGRRGR